MSSEERGEKEAELLRSISKIQSSIAEMTSGTTFKALDELGQASLEFRLTRSRYYLRLFESQIKLLRIEPIEGYQPYDLFNIVRLDRRQLWNWRRIYHVQPA